MYTKCLHLIRSTKELLKFPAVSRDISMVVPKDIPVGKIEEAIESKAGKNLESYSLFDIYEGDQIEDGFKSVAYQLYLELRTEHWKIVIFSQL